MSVELPTMTAEKEAQQHILHMQLPPQERALRNDGAITDHTYIIMLGEKIREQIYLPQTIQLPEGTFQVKDEFHVTALNFGKTAEEIMQRSQAEDGNEFRAAINKALSEIDFSFDLDLSTLRIIHNLDYDSELVVGQRTNPQTPPAQGAFESEYTITVDVVMPGMQEFYNRMRDLGVELGEPSTHVTLYIKEQLENDEAKGMGIALNNFEQQLIGEAFPHIEAHAVSAEELGIELN